MKYFHGFIIKFAQMEKTERKKSCIVKILYNDCIIVSIIE